MIEDEKLRELFRAESEEHLQHLDDALLRLELSPADQPLLEEAFREAHSLKGAARMLGLSAIQAPAHRLEDELNAARRGAQPLGKEAITRMSVELAALRRLTLEALATGAANQKDTTPDVKVPPQSALPSVIAASSAAAPAAAAAMPPAAAPFRIESVRVDTRSLDALMTHAGELTVTRTRMARRLTDIDALIEITEARAPREAARGLPLSVANATGAAQRMSRLGELLGRLRTVLADDCTRLDYIAGELESGIRRARLLPLSGVFRLFPRLVHELAQEQGKAVELTIEGEETRADTRILEEIKDPLMHMLRNAVDHGIELPQAREQSGKPRKGVVHIKASQTSNSVTIEIADDGRGLDEAAIKRAAAKFGVASAEALTRMSSAQIQSLIFSPGMSTASFVTEVSGRGVGMGVVRTNVERLKGTIALHSTPHIGTRITIVLPVTLATVRVLLVEVNGHPYGLPAEHVHVMKQFAAQDVFAIEGRSTILHLGRPVSVARLADLLELPQTGAQEKAPGAPCAIPCVVLSAGGELFGVFVDGLINEQEVVLKPLSALLERVRNVSGATILDSGEICMVLNPWDLLAAMRRRTAPPAPSGVVDASVRKKAILLAEDSITTRTQETRILENAGYEVVATADGLEAWNRLATRVFDAVVTDVTMPNLDGLGLAERIRREAKYAELPIILVTSLSSEQDKRRGLEAGANAYLVKTAFDQQTLLDCLQRLI